VLLQRGLGDHVGRLVQPRVDHLHAVVAQDGGDGLRAAVVTVEAGLADQDADLAGAHAETSFRAYDRRARAPRIQAQVPKPTRRTPTPGCPSLPLETRAPTSR